MAEEKIYKLDEITEESTPEERIAWIKGLNASGYAGCRKGDGMIVDRREYPDAIAVQKNSMFGVVEPKKLPE